MRTCEGEVAWAYQDREKVKTAAWPELRDKGLDMNLRVRALLNIIEAHYWRAREHLENKPAAFLRKVHGSRYSKGYLLDIDVYTENWLAANHDNPSIPGPVVDRMMYEYSYKKTAHKMLPNGETSYRSDAPSWPAVTETFQ